MVGEGVRSEPSLVGRVFGAIDDTQLGLILHGSSPITMSFVVAEADVERVIERLHGVFFSHLDPQVFK
jgi:aspartokinase